MKAGKGKRRPKRTAKQYRFFDHTADMGLQVRGATLPRLFENAARGLMALLVEHPRARTAVLRKTIFLKAPDLETLLIRWFNELLYQYTSKNFVFLSAFRTPRSALSGKAGWRLKTVVAGMRLVSLRHGPLREVKAATYSGLKIRKAAQDWAARVIFDV